MRLRNIVLGCLVTSAIFSGNPSQAETPSSISTVGTKIAGFSLKDTQGKTWSLAGLKSKKPVVILFVGTQCPINNAFMPRLAELHNSYAAKGVQFLAINANLQDCPETIAAHAGKHKLPFPVLRDNGNVVADLFAARRTPEAFVLDAGSTVRYQGRIDDQFGVGFARPRPTRSDLALAIDEVLAGKAVTRPTTPVAGCLIARAIKTKKTAAVTYAKHISRILQKYCQECHRPGQIGPMSLLTYRDASAWSDTIREVIEEKRMPPWHADPKHGKFQNDRSLPKADRDALLAWIDAGCPKGDEKDLPAPVKHSEGWRIGKPDAVFTMKSTVKVPARAAKGIKYKYFLVNTKFAEDVWVQAAEARPGNRAVVHHIIVYAVDLKKGRPRSGDGIGNGFLVAHAPGDLPSIYAAGYAKKIPKGATLAFQMHYTPNGVEQTDQSSVGLVFAKKPPQYEIRTRSIARRGLFIPAGDPNYKAVASTTFNEEATLVSMFPHMHLRGKDFHYRVSFPDGKSETVLSVPRYDFNWQNNYRLEKPLTLPAGTRIECTAHYDNSTANPNNPDPTKTVRWGDQTWDEMMIGFVDYAVPTGKADKKS